VPLKVVATISLALILLSSPIPLPVNIRVNTPITTTVYDAQVTNLNGGNADEGITYKIKGTNADKFSITSFTDTIISCSALLPATSVATMVTVSLSCTDVCIAL
jgi:hypothetical protein